ncbi:hypothetical protein K443DRAFT_684505 [Laccaria amethystina LaAM-08-1]|uniref:Uncharacterized protein n=1 Tax=Laccaria amethystina LaAM-08-1 TaxID=1095629 RepID=A0A0C9WXE5_9AGAR|nr:hypothetical protein K443DRAFT_684505 [Laccaria amethystina LaAM-08-1]
MELQFDSGIKLGPEGEKSDVVSQCLDQSFHPSSKRSERWYHRLHDSDSLSHPRHFQPKAIRV